MLRISELSLLRVSSRLLILVCLASMVGCGEKSGSGGASEAGASSVSQTPPESAHEVMDRMFEVYRNAKSYSDKGRLNQVVIENGIRREQPPIPFEVIFERPGRIHLTMFGSRIASDGRRFRAVLPELQPQLLDRAAPKVITLENLFGDPILGAKSTPGQKEFNPPQIDLLLSANPQQEELRDASLRLLEPEATNGKLCYRVEAKTEDGLRVYWIDQDSFLLRRMDAPVDRLTQQDAKGNRVGLEAWFELTDAQINPELSSEVFVLAEPKPAVRLTRFVMPPPNRASQPLGNSIGDYAFYDLEDKEVRAATLADKVYVLEYWSTTCQPCKDSFPKIEEAARALKDSGVKVYAVNADPAGVENDETQKTLASWGVGLPQLRDRNQQLFQSLNGQVPTTVLIGPGGRIHSIMIGAQDDYSELVDEAKKLVAGTDIAKQKLDAMHESFQKQLTAAASRDAAVDIEIPRAQISKRADPKQFEIEKLWQAKSVKQPGNLLVVNTPGEDPTFLVLDEGRFVVELDKAGKEANRFDLGLPDGELASALRTAIDDDGRRYFVAFSPGQNQLHLFDEQWQKQMSYPEGEDARIADVQITDLDGDGKLSLVVGFLGVVGVHRVELDGERSWSNRELENVWQIGLADAPNTKPDVTKAAKQILVTSPQGVVSVLDHRGNTLPPIVVRGHAILRAVAADPGGDDEPELCGLASLGLGRWQVVGFNRSGGVLWTYDLPQGEHIQQIERIVAVKLPNGATGWVVPSADGSVHLLDHSGDLRDQFASGEELAGVGATLMDGQTALILSGADGVTAWKLTPGDE